MDERIGFKTPQQPIKLGANTDKAKCALSDDFFKKIKTFAQAKVFLY